MAWVQVPLRRTRPQGISPVVRGVGACKGAAGPLKEFIGDNPREPRDLSMTPRGLLLIAALAALVAPAWTVTAPLGAANAPVLLLDFAKDTGERRPREEENHAAVAEVYRALGAGDRVKYLWYAGDHDFPPAARRAAGEWFRRWLLP